MYYRHPPLEILDGEIGRAVPSGGTGVELAEDENGYVGWLLSSGHCAPDICSARRRSACCGASAELNCGCACVWYWLDGWLLGDKVSASV